MYCFDHPVLQLVYMIITIGPISLHNTEYYGIYDTNVFRPKYESGNFFEISGFMNNKIMEGMYIYITSYYSFYLHFNL